MLSKGTAASSRSSASRSTRRPCNTSAGNLSEDQSQRLATA